MKTSNFDYLDRKLTLNWLDLLKNMCSYTCCIFVLFLLRCTCCGRWGGMWFIYFSFISLVSYQGVFWELLSLGWKESLCLTKEKTSRTKFGIGMLVMVQFSSVTQLCPTLCDPMNRSTPGLTVHHQLPEFTQTHVHRVGDAIQPSHPLSSPSPAPNPSQHQGLFQWVSSSHQVAKVLEFQLQHQSFQWTPMTGLL